MKYVVTQNGFELAVCDTALSAFKKAKKLSYLFLNLKVETRRER